VRALVTVSESVLVPAAPDELWPYLTEKDLLRAWRPGLEQFGQGELPTMGETLPISQEVAGHRLTGEAVLVQIDPGRALCYELGWPGHGYLAVRYDLWPQKTGCKLVATQTVGAPGIPLVRALLGRLFVAPKLREELRRDLGELREQLAGVANSH